MNDAVFGPEIFDRLRHALLAVPPTTEVVGRRGAAVLIPLFLSDGEVRVLLTKRSRSLRRHSGEVSFPGGTHEPTDTGLWETALRETFEEVGLRGTDVERLGVLDDLPTAASGYVIRPYVARVPHPYDYVLDEREVERLLSPPLGLFADPLTRRVERWERDGVVYPVYFFDYGRDVIWGATARLLVALFERLGGRTPHWTGVVDPTPAPADPDPG